MERRSTGLLVSEEMKRVRVSRGRVRGCGWLSERWVAEVKSSVELYGKGSEELVRKGGVEDAILRRSERRGSLRGSESAIVIWERRLCLR